MNSYQACPRRAPWAKRSPQHNPRYLANRKSNLIRWRHLLAELDRLDAAAHGVATPFMKALHDIFAAGATRKALARKIRMPLATLKRWERGATPTRRSIHYVDRIESALSMTPGVLRGLLPAVESHLTPISTAAGSSAATPEQPKDDRYQLHPRDVIEHLIQQWRQLCAYKTQRFAWDIDSDIPDEIQNITRWRTFEIPNGKRVRYPWITVVDGRFCGSAAHYFTILAAFVGWMQLSTEYGGLGMKAENAQTLAHFADPQKIRAYVLWRRKRSKGKYTRTTERFLTFASMLCRPETGFLYRFPEIGNSVGIADELSWRDCCSQAGKLISVIKRGISTELVVTRDPAKLYATLINQENPIRIFGEAIKRHIASRPTTGGIREAIWLRDLVMLFLFASCPLRPRNMIELTYTRENTGHLKQTSEGEWIIEIPRALLKNGQHQPDLIAFVVKSARPYLERYLRHYRHHIDTSTYVLPSAKGGGAPWDKLSCRFSKLTARYLDGFRGADGWLRFLGQIS